MLHRLSGLRTVAPALRRAHIAAVHTRWLAPSTTSHSFRLAFRETKAHLFSAEAQQQQQQQEQQQQQSQQNTEPHPNPKLPHGVWLTIVYILAWVYGITLTTPNGIEKFFRSDESDFAKSLSLFITMVPDFESVLRRLLSNKAFLEETNYTLYHLTQGRQPNERTFDEMLLFQLSIVLHSFPALCRDLIADKSLLWLPETLKTWVDYLSAMPANTVSEDHISLLELTTRVASALTAYVPEFRAMMSVDTAIDLFMLGEHLGHEGLSCEAARMISVMWQTGGSLIILDSGVIDTLIDVNYHEPWWTNLGRATSSALHTMRSSIPQIPDNVVDDMERKYLLHEDSFQLSSYTPSHDFPTLIENNAFVIEVFGAGSVAYVWGAIRGAVRARLRRLSGADRKFLVRACGKRASIGASLLVLLMQYVHPNLHSLVQPRDEPMSYKAGPHQVSASTVNMLDGLVVLGYALINWRFPFSTLSYLANPVGFLGIQPHKDLQVTHN